MVDAHARGLTAAQKNTVELTPEEAHGQIGFDFAIAEECVHWRECGGYRALYGDLVFAIEAMRLPGVLLSLSGSM